MSATAIAICGSPRKEGNTETLLQDCLDTLAKAGIGTELVRLSGKSIRPCTACCWCREQKDGTCVIKDDDFHPILEKMKAADIIITGSPVYFGSATPELMALLDRAGYVSRGNGQFFSRKLGGALTVGRRSGQNFTLSQLLFWYMINDMVVPGSTYWTNAFGGAAGEVTEDESGRKTAVRFAENLAWLAGHLIDDS